MKCYLCGEEGVGGTDRDPCKYCEEEQDEANREAELAADPYQPDPCPSCGGSGERYPYEASLRPRAPERCDTCNGGGTVHSWQRSRRWV